MNMVRSPEGYLLSERRRADPADVVAAGELVRARAIPGQRGFFVVEVPKAEKGTKSYYQIVLQQTPRGVSVPLISSGNTTKFAPVPGLTMIKDKAIPTSATLVASEAYFAQRLRQMRDGTLKMAKPMVVPLYDLAKPAEFAALNKDWDATVAAARAAAKNAAANKAKAEEKKKLESAKREADRLANNRKWYGRWLYVIEKDPMTDEMKQYVYGFPNGFDDPGKSPYLRIGCYKQTSKSPMGVTFFWAESLSDMFPRDQMDMARVTARFDQRAPIDMGWAVSGDFASTYPPDPLAGSMAQLGTSLLGAILPGAAGAKTNSVWSAKDLHNSLRGANQAVFRGYPRSGRDLTLMFDLLGYRKAIANFDDHCNR